MSINSNKYKHNPELNTPENFKLARTDSRMFNMLVENNIALVNQVAMKRAINQQQFEEFASEGILCYPEQY